ncbi:MAG: peptidoglycan-binding domain-containing protein [Candidatus Binataceae bacterium]
MDALGSGQSDLHGAEIAAWQRFLSLKGFYGGPISGDYDSQTRDATEKFQKTVGADSDGIVGPETVDLARREGFVVPSGRPDRDHFNLDYDVQLTPELEEVVREIAYH